jgi:hypothetical protein
MFSKDITGSDAFIDMPSSSQALYFHLGMEADDDGFIGNPKRIQKVVGTGDDDMRILISKRFVLVFPSGVVVIKHHRINNNWDKYNCKRTPYIDEFNQLFIKQNKAYTLDSTQGVPVQSENSLKTVFRIEENRIDITDKSEKRIEKYNPDQEDQPLKKASLSKDTRSKYDKLITWAENERGFPFLVGSRLKQYKAFTEAKANKLNVEQLTDRWQEMATDKFWSSNGFDWMDVVKSFNKKA